MALFVWGEVLQWPECDRESVSVGEFEGDARELGCSERDARDPDVFEGVAPCICFSRRRKDCRRFDMMESRDGERRNATKDRNIGVKRKQRNRLERRKQQSTDKCSSRKN